MTYDLDRHGVIVPCASCGTRNRLGYGTLDKTTRCPKCKAMLATPDAPIDVPDGATFEALAETSVVPVVVDFWAAWCGPCRMVAPELEKVARAHAGQWLVVKVDTEKVTDIAARYSIRSLPTLAVVYQGRERGRIVGVRPAAEIERFVAGTVTGETRRAS